MKEYERFCKSLNTMKEIDDYQEPYDNVILTGIVCIYRSTFEQSWKMMKEILEKIALSIVNDAKNEFYKMFVTLKEEIESGWI